MSQRIRTAADSDRCLIGIDAGTSVVKAVAFDHAGSELMGTG